MRSNVVPWCLTKYEAQKSNTVPGKCTHCNMHNNVSKKKVFAEYSFGTVAYMFLCPRCERGNVIVPNPIYNLSPAQRERIIARSELRDPNYF